MSRLKKALALLLVLLMVPCLSACGGFAGRMARAALKMQKLQSLRMDIDVDLGMRLSMFGEDLDLDLEVTGPIDLITSPLKAKAALQAAALGETSDILCYMEQVGSRLVVHTSVDNGETWERTDIDTPAPSAGGGLNAKSIAGLAKLASAFQESGTETVRGSQAVVYHGAVPMSDLEQIVDFSKIPASIEKSSGIKIDESALDFSAVAPIPVTLCIDDDSGMIVKFSVDLTGPMQVLIPVVLQAAVKSALDSSPLAGLGDLGDLNLGSLGSLGFEMNLSKALVSAELYDFDRVSQITIPSEAISAQNAA